MSRPVYDYSTASKAAYNDFKAENPSSTLDYATYRKVIVTWNTLFSSHILETGEICKLPYGIGPFSINKKKQKLKKTLKDGTEVSALAVDYKRSKEFGKTIYHMNYHTEGYRYHWVWFTSESKIRYARYMFTFQPCRINSRQLAKNLLQPNSPYVHTYHEWYQPKLR